MKTRFKFKKALSVLLMAAMIFAVLPSAALAATHYIASEAGLRSAIAAASGGDTIRINADITLTSDLSIDKNVTLTSDNSSTLNATNSYYINIPAGVFAAFEGNLIVTGAYSKVIDAYGDIALGENASVIQTGASGTGIYINNGCIADIADSAIVNSTGLGIYNAGTTSMSGGTVKGNGDECAIRNWGGALKISNGVIGSTDGAKRGIQLLDGKVDISGGSISGKEYAVDVSPNVTLSISGGSFAASSDAYYALECSGTATITGGIFSTGKITTTDSGVIHIDISGGGSLTLPASGVSYSDAGSIKKFLTALPGAITATVGQQTDVSLTGDSGVVYAVDSSTDTKLGAVSSGATAVSVTPTAAGSYKLVLTAAGTGAATTQSLKLTLPVTVSAAAAAVCEIGATQYATLDGALAAVTSGQTIRLLDNITYTEPIEVNGKDITFDLGNYNLSLDTSANVAKRDTPALKVTDGGKVRLAGTGKFNVKGYFTGVDVVGANSEATVNNVTVTATEACAVKMVGSGMALDGGKLTVNGDIKAEASNSVGIDINAKNGKIIVNGDIAAGRMGIFTSANPGTEVTVNGNLSVADPAAGNQVQGIYANALTTVHVIGNVSVSGADCIGVYAYGATIIVNGDVTSPGIGAQAKRNDSYGNGAVTIDGCLSAGSPFVIVGDIEKEANQTTLPTTKDGYLTYTDGKSTVWAKTAEALAAPTVTSVTVTPDIVTVQRGNTQSFSATVNGTNNPAQTVTWSVSGANKAGTTISASGDLTIQSVVSGAHSTSIAEDSSGNLYYLSYVNASKNSFYIIEKPAGGDSVNIAGGGAGLENRGITEGIASSSALISNPWKLLPYGSALYFTDTGAMRIRKVSGGNVYTVLGDGSAYSDADGAVSSLTRIHDPKGLAADASGNLYFSELTGNKVRVLSADGSTLTTVAGQNVSGMAIAGYSGDGGAATAALLNHPNGIALDASGNLYIADTGNHVIREVSASNHTQYGITMQKGYIYTIAGGGSDTGDGGSARLAKLSSPRDIIVAPDGTLYLAELHRIRTISTDGTIATVAGSTASGYAGDGGNAAGALFNNPCGLALDKDGNLLIADTMNERIRKVNAAAGASCVLTVAADETAEALIVTATSIVDPAKSGMAAVTLSTATASVWPAGSTMVASDTTDTSTVLTWTAVNEARDYAIYRGNGFIGVTSKDTCTYTATGLSPDTEYTFKVQAAYLDKVSGTGTWTTDGPSVTVRTSKTPPAGTYTVMVNGSYAGATGAGSYAQGDAVAIHAGTRSNYSFTGWTSPDGVIFSNAGSPTTTFTMPAKNVSVTANWSYNGGGGSGGGYTTPPAPAYQAVVKAGNNAETAIPVAVDKVAGTASVDAGFLNRAQGGTVITVPSIPGVGSYTVGIPVPRLSTAAPQGTLTLETVLGSVTVPSNMLTGAQGISGDMAVISIGAGDKAGLRPDVKAAVGNRPLVQLTLSIDGKRTDWNNPKAPVTISIPYKPAAAELANSESIIIWYIDGSGNAVPVPNGHYDPVSGAVTFTVAHFSEYAIGYNKVKFKDVASTARYGKAISFIAARGITTVAGNGKYKPGTKLTRGESVVLLMRAFGIAPDTSPADNFADAGNTYYTGYLAAAKRLGITAGVGNNLYAPGKRITRQEMFTQLYNVLKTIGQLPQVSDRKAFSDFSDANKVASWAKEAMALLVETGTISGSGGKLNPTGAITRAEMAQVLYNLLRK